KIYDAQTGRAVPDLPLIEETGYTYLKNVLQVLDDAARTGGFQISQREAVQSILKDPKQLSYQGAGPWASVVQNVGVQLPQRLARDQQTLIDQRLITPGHQLSTVTFSGSDFHNGGQQVLFLTFTDPNAGADGAPRTVVYKPSSLAVDAELFGR